MGAGGFEPPFEDNPLAEPPDVLHELLEALKSNEEACTDG
jgi:hypothetical protein